MKSPQEQAEQLYLEAIDRIEASGSYSELRHIPLPELIAIAQAAESILSGTDHGDIESFRNSHKGQVAMEISCGDVVAIHDALKALRATGKVEL